MSEKNQEYPWLETQAEISKTRREEYTDRLYEFLSRRRVMIGYTVFPALLLFVLINLIPILWAFAASFFQISVLSPSWDWVGLANYAAVINDSLFSRSLWIAFVFTVGSLALQLTVGIGVGILLARDFKFSSIIRSFAFIPFFVPTAVLALMTLWITNTSYGILNYALIDLGIIGQPVAFFGDPAYALYSVIFVNGWKQVVLVAVLVVARLQGIPDSQYEAAKLFGANRWQLFRDVTLPELRNVLFIIIFLRSIWEFLKFDVPYLLTRGGPNDSTLMPAIYAYRQALEQFSIGEAGATSVILFLMLVVGAIGYFHFLEPSKEVRT